uniref:DRBM domain-containing protein n=1 Tax=Angiostrongylus cantonensis TaxID=6313 RepID=A0A158P628_ANGCA
MDPYVYTVSLGNGNFRAPPQSEPYSYGWGSSPVCADVAPRNFRKTSYPGSRQGSGDLSKVPKDQLGPNRAGIGYGRWIAPGVARPPLGVEGGTFPKKGWATPPFGQHFFKKTKKETDPTGKTPAMLLHELFKDVSETYEEVASHPKAYRCILTVLDQQFSMVAPAKKTAKQKTAEIALRTLRPDLNITPFEDGVTVQPVVTDAVTPAQPSRRPVPQSDGEGAPPAKKIKLTALESALSLLDCLRKLCAERVSEGPFNPVFDIVDITESGATPGDKRKFRATLTFAEQGKIYTHEGFGKICTRDVAVREALLDLFKVPQAEIRRIVRRHLMGKLTDMPIIQTLYQVAHLCGCEVAFKVDIATEQKAIGHAPSPFVAVCTLTDHSMGGKTVEFTSPPSRSKHEAKEYVAHELLRLCVIDSPDLYAVFNEPEDRFKIEVTPNIKYEDLGLVDESMNQMGMIFKSKLIINDKEEFIGCGKSKKAAKNDAALLALKKIFMFDYNNPESMAMAEASVKARRGRNHGCSQLCLDVSEYSKRDYYGMCSYYAVKHSTEVAAFFFVNDQAEKRLVAIASSRPGVVDGQTVGTARGTAIIHFDPIVLARRSLIRYLITEAAKVGDPKCIFVRDEDGMLRLNECLRLVLYATYPPNCSYSCSEAAVKKLSCLGPKFQLCPVPDNVQTMTDIEQSGVLNVHCVADKIFKWNNIGVQGALLSTLMHPILPHSIYFGSSAPVPDASLMHALFGRLEAQNRPFIVESIKSNIVLSRSPSHIWTRDMEHVEMLNPESGRTTKGSPSRLCKAAIFEAFLKLASEDMKCSTYMEAKQRAVAYNVAKNSLYKKMEEAGFGKWQTKPEKLVDFSLDSFDA